MDSTSKLIFFYDAISQKKVIEAQTFNDVFSDFEEKFYKNKPYKSAMANFKKYMKLAAENKGHKIAVIPASADTSIHGIRNIWRLIY
jgi:inhibitor of KinA sporulation pathway (predicted exonuclease)